MGMHVALVNSFAYHYEVFGSFIYYCYKKNYSLVLFTETQRNYGWIDFYHSYFSLRGYFFLLKPLSDFTQVTSRFFDLIFLPSANDPKVPPFGHERMVALQHNLDHKLKIQPFRIMYTRNTLHNLEKNLFYIWVPAFPMLVPPPRKKTKEGPKKIILIGERMDDTQTIDILSQHFQFLHITRKSRLNQSIEKCEKCDMAQVFEMAADADFIGVFVKPTNGHVHRTMSGSIPFAVSLQIPLILPKNMNKYYHLRSALEYDPQRPLSHLVSSIQEFQPNKDLLAKDLQQIVDHNHQILDRFIPLLPPPVRFLTTTQPRV